MRICVFDDSNTEMSERSEFVSCPVTDEEEAKLAEEHLHIFALVWWQREGERETEGGDWVVVILSLVLQ